MIREVDELISKIRKLDNGEFDEETVRKIIETTSISLDLSIRVERMRRDEA